MLGRAMGGKHTCYVCGKEINWETEYKGYPGDVGEDLPVPAQESALGRLDGGVVVFEISYVCPQCKTKNKLRAERHV
ncbi:hypothetical protein NE619_10550 [Anaerovorax odorimutans]|uniref:Uncharacterized protein n=1 Tax=Anaerovorax odorimutans TaxID=109327 RepID=A0ABT1RPQ2_9FIRM|nr:hypothetical protein [Anaerovorax odorimutans]MCQ4637165.1 hypothetical protein [Anaerovorax odorimutans]